MTAGRLLIALDVDGTVVRPDGIVTPRVRAAVRAAHEAGHHVVLATGRSPGATLPVLATLGLTGAYAVCSNGAVTLRTGARIIAETTFDPAGLLRALARDLPGCAVAVEAPGARGFLVTAGFPAGELTGDVTETSWAGLGGVRARRVIVEGADPARFAALARELGLTGLADTTGRTGGMEAGPPGVSKASALESLRAALPVPAASTVAVGDHVNDVEMLRWAARGVAMGHAPAAVRATATEVTGTWAEDGLAQVLETTVHRGETHGNRVRGRLPHPGAGPDRGAQLGLHPGR